jgi:hypothetical protein
MSTQDESTNETADSTSSSAEPEKHLIAVASNPQQMQIAQRELITWADKRMEILSAERTEAWNNLEQAKKHKWKSSPFQTQVNKLVNQIQFYEKLKGALEAGYTIVPNFQDIDVFAVRTTSKKPQQNYAEQNAIHGKVIPNDQTPDCPPMGEGRFVNATAEYRQQKQLNGKDDKGQDKWLQTAEAIKHANVDFPFKLVKPEIMIATKMAMDCLVFDDMACLPKRRQARRGDPMIIGRIHCGPWRYGSPAKTLSFLVTWFIDTKTL